MSQENPGYATPFVSIYYIPPASKAGGAILFINDLFAIEKTTYTYDEEGSDSCVISFRGSSLPLTIADHPAFQDNSQLNVTWGLLGVNQVTRKVWVKDTKWQFDKNGVTLTLEATDKGMVLNQNRSSKVHRKGNGLTIPHSIGIKNGLKTQYNLGPSLKELQRKKGESLLDWKKRRPGVISDYRRSKIKNPNDLPENLDLQKMISSGDLYRSIKEQQRRYNEIEDSFLGVPTKVQREKMALDIYKKRIAEVERKKYGLTEQQIKQEAREISEILISTFGTSEAASRAIAGMKDIPQANKTDKQIIDETIRRLPSDTSGSWVAETRDDTLTIKRRNFNSIPLRAYSYAEGTGELFSFTPETKNISHAGKSVAAVASAFNDTFKAYTTKIDRQLGDLNNRVNRSLAMYIDTLAGPKASSVISANTKAQQDKGFWQKYGYDTDLSFGANLLGYYSVEAVREEIKDPQGQGTGVFHWVYKPKGVLGNLVGDTYSKEYQAQWERMHPTVGQTSLRMIDEGKLDDADYIQTFYIDKNTGAPISRARFQELAYQKGLYNSEDNLTDFQLSLLGLESIGLTVYEVRDMKENPEKYLNGSAFMDPTGQDNSDGFTGGRAGGHANKKNPAQALVWGDTSITTGNIFTILNVGKKHSGNYYCRKSIHTIEPQSGYTVALEMMRNGTNIKSNTIQQSLKNSDRAINTEMGIDKRSIRTKRLREVRNGR